MPPVAPPSPSPSSSPPPPVQPPPPVKAVRWSVPLTLLLCGLLLGVWLWRATLESAAHPMVDYSVFRGWVEGGKVALVVISGPVLDVELEEAASAAGRVTKYFRTARPDGDEALVPLLLDKKVRIRVTPDEQDGVVPMLVAFLPWIVLIAISIWASQRAQKMLVPGGEAAGGLLKRKPRKYEKNLAVDVTFEDVAGLQSAKRDLQEVVQFLREPERFRRLGGKVPRGVLLLGPPGTGKTLLARAVAGESGVPFFSISASEFIEVFVGLGAARVRDLFEEAKQNAPAIIFIDEIDAIGRTRGAGFGGGQDEREQTLNQLLSEMDGFNRNDLTVVLAATNRPDVLDSALLRPGRFDRRVIVDRPELDARRAILDVHVKNKPLGKDVNLDSLAKTTPGFSGADLANLVNEAALHATRQGASEICALDFAEAYDKIVLGDPREAKLGPEEARRIAVHEAGHTIVAQFSPDAELPQRVTIIPRGLALGATQQTPAGDRHLMTQPQLESRLRVLMGGYAAERLVCGSVSSGAENDLKEATKLASNMVAHYGMSSVLGAAYYEHDLEHPFLGQRLATEGSLSDATVHAIEEEARKFLARAHGAASELLTRRRSELDRLVQALLEKETLEAEDLKRLLGTAAAPAVAGIPAVAAATVWS